MFNNVLSIIIRKGGTYENSKKDIQIKLIQYRDSDFVKVITGVRRAGKSSLLVLFKEYLLEQGVEEKQIVEINYEKFIYDDLKDGLRLHNHLKEKTVDEKKNVFSHR